MKIFLFIKKYSKKSLLSLREKVREEDHRSSDEKLLPTTSKAIYASVRGGQKGRQQMGLQRGPVQSRIQQSRSTTSTTQNRSNSTTSDEVASIIG